MSELEPLQSNEELESGEEVKATRELDEITHEPESRIENKGSVEQAETIETTLKEIVDSSPETQAGGKLDDSQGKYEEPLRELNQELPHQEKLGGQKQIPGQEGMPGMDDMPGSKLPGMDNMPGGKNLPGMDDSPDSDFLGGNEPLGGWTPPDGSVPGDVPGGDILGGFKPDGGDMPGGFPGGDDLPGKSGIPGEGGGMPKPPNIYEADGNKGQKGGEKGGDKGQKGGEKGQKGGEKGQKGGEKGQKADVTVNVTGRVYTPKEIRQMEVQAMNAEAAGQTGLYNQIINTLGQIYDSGGDGNYGTVVIDRDTTEDMGEPIPPDAVEVRPGMIPGEEITDPPHPDFAGKDSDDAMAGKPEVIEATTVDPDSSGGRVPIQAVKVRPGMIPGEEITDPPHPDMAGKSSEDAVSAQSSADVQAADSDEKKSRESDQEAGKKETE